MGNCGGGPKGGTAEERNISRNIDKELQKDVRKLNSNLKLLLLGAGESGKSTIAKQMKIIHMDGFSDQERIAFRAAIHSNVITSMRNLVKACDDLQIALDPNNVEIADPFLAPTFLSKNMVLTPELAKKVKTLWDDAGIKEAFNRSSEFQLNDSAAYFFDKIDLVIGDFIPDDTDILRARVMTTGVQEIEFAIENISFRMVDVGGQRSERKKWIHCFEGITAIIFCAALSEYDLKLQEDTSVNRMWESLKIFDEICNIKWFEKASIILFLNKQDIFQEKIKRVKLQPHFPEYTGPEGNYEKAVEFIQKQFLSKNKTNRQIFAHITIATNTENIRVVFNAVKSCLLDTTVGELGF